MAVLEHRDLGGVPHDARPAQQPAPPPERQPHAGHVRQRQVFRIDSRRRRLGDKEKRAQRAGQHGGPVAHGAMELGVCLAVGQQIEVVDAIEHHRRHPAGAQQVARHGQGVGEPLRPQDRQVVQPHAAAHQVVDIDGGADVHIGHLLAAALGPGQRASRHGGLSRRAITDQLTEPAPRQPPDPQGIVQRLKAGGTDGHIGLWGVPGPVDGPRAPAPLQGGNRGFEACVSSHLCHKRSSASLYRTFVL